MDEPRFFYWTDGSEVQRPVSKDVLCLLYRNQIIGAATHLCREGETEWQLLNPKDFRAQRRSLQGENDIIQQRDSLDQQRRNSPLTCAPDALRLDSGRASVGELIDAALRHLASRGLKATS